VTPCKRGHTHENWTDRIACDFDTVSPRDQDGYLIRTPGPVAPGVPPSGTTGELFEESA